MTSRALADDVNDYLHQKEIKDWRFVLVVVSIFLIFIGLFFYEDLPTLAPLAFAEIFMCLYYLFWVGVSVYRHRHGFYKKYMGHDNVIMDTMRYLQSKS